MRWLIYDYDALDVCAQRGRARHDGAANRAILAPMINRHSRHAAGYNGVAIVDSKHQVIIDKMDELRSNSRISGELGSSDSKFDFA